MIPSFGQGDVLPPFIGTDVAGHISPRSPYNATMSELVDRFATSAERAAILRGLKGYRDALRNIGYTDGFQWINGSFVEDCEKVKQRPPNDIDVVNVLFRPTRVKSDAPWTMFVNLHGSTVLDPAWSKANFKCDSYFIDLDTPPDIVAGQSAYWFGLFSHQRNTFRWKGMVQVSLQSDDDTAMQLLASKGLGW
jgi:hypothetical protein